MYIKMKAENWVCEFTCEEVDLAFEYGAKIRYLISHGGISVYDGVLVDGKFEIQMSEEGKMLYDNNPQIFEQASLDIIKEFASNKLDWLIKYKFNLFFPKTLNSVEVHEDGSVYVPIRDYGPYGHTIINKDGIFCFSTNLEAVNKIALRIETMESICTLMSDLSIAVNAGAWKPKKYPTKIKL